MKGFSLVCKKSMQKSHVSLTGVRYCKVAMHMAWFNPGPDIKCQLVIFDLGIISLTSRCLDASPRNTPVTLQDLDLHQICYIRLIIMFCAFPLQGLCT